VSHESWLELADVYALGTLDGDERRTFETHLATGCAGCGARIRETGETLMHLARTLPPVPAPPAVGERVLAAVSSERRPVGQPEAEATLESRPARARRARHLLWWGGWATALGAAGLLVVVGVSLTQTREELERLRGRVAVLQDELTEREATLRFLSDPKVRYVSLGGLAASPAAPPPDPWPAAGAGGPRVRALGHRRIRPRPGRRLRRRSSRSGPFQVAGAPRREGIRQVRGDPGACGRGAEAERADAPPRHAMKLRLTPPSSRRS